MEKKRNWSLWLGFGTTLLAAGSYVPFFSRFPVTRDFPWANLLLFAVAGWLLGVGLRRAFAQPGAHWGRIMASVLAALSLGVFGMFCYGIFYHARDLPSREAALRVGQQAPDFTLAGTDGNPVTLSQLREGRRAVLLIFYRGYW
jgi:AhpC/TSA family